jgi:hypothetical protein
MLKAVWVILAFDCGQFPPREILQGIQTMGVRKS